MLSLFVFILVLGIVVDDVIIMGEFVYFEIDVKGYSIDNVIVGVKKVVMFVIFGVLIMIVVFFLMLMVFGLFGVIWKIIGLVVIVCLVFFLIELKLILFVYLVYMKMKFYDLVKVNVFQ